LTSGKVTSGLVAEVIEAFQYLSSFDSVRLVWAPGHWGTSGNEKADFLAKQASQTPLTGPASAVGLSLTVTTVRDAINKWSIRQQWKLWQSLPGCRQSKEMMRKPPDAVLSKSALVLDLT